MADAALRGGDLATQAKVWQWASWADSELLPASCAWVFPYLGIMQFNKQVIDTLKSADIDKTSGYHYSCQYWELDLK